MVPRREDLVGFEQLRRPNGPLHHLHAGVSQQPDDPLPGDPVQEGPVRHRRVAGAVLPNHHVLRRELGHVTDRVAHHRVVEAAPVRIGNRQPGERVETRRLAVGRCLLGAGPAVG